MTGRADSNAWVRTALSSCSRILIVVLTLAGVVATAAGVDAASVSLSWSAPTTNADGTPLTDLANYRVYLATTAPSCPSASFLTVSSPTSTPPAGQTVASRVTALTAGATYFVRITAVDGAGNQSSCSPSASGVAQVDFNVTPTATTDFGSVTTGGLVDRTFTVQNTSTASISGAATVGAPFSITSGGSFSLSPGASQTVTVRFAPTTVGTFAGNVNVTAGGDTVSRGVSGSATAAPVPVTLTVARNGTGTGTVTSSPAGIACGADCTETVAVGTQFTLTAAAASGSTFAGWSGACGGTGTCAVTLNAGTTVTATFNTAPASVPPSPAPVTLTVTRIGTGTGTVTSSPAGIACGADCTETVPVGTQFTLTTAAASGSIFAGWSGACSGTGACAVTLNASATATATFNTALVSSTPPPAPRHPSVKQIAADATGVTFAVTWGIVNSATSYRWTAGFKDGSAAQQGTVTVPSAQLRMPYHVSGAATGGFVCLRSVNAAGQQSTDQSCSGFKVPARPAPTSNPVPVVTSLSPSSAVAQGPGFTLTVNGSGFVASSVVRWNGVNRATTFVSSTQIRAGISSADNALAGSVPVSVFTPTPGGGTSNMASFTITPPPAPVPTTPPAAPGSPSVTRLAADASGVTFAISWSAGSGATSYRYIAGYGDGSATQQGSVTGLLSFQLRMPYHSSGAAVSGFVCLRSVSATGEQSADQSCNAVPVPAAP